MARENQPLTGTERSTMLKQPMSHGEDPGTSSKIHTIKRFGTHGKMKIELTMNQPKEGRSHKPELGMTGKPTVTKTMARDFGKTHKGAK